jgi:hypothetical protein
MFKTGDYCKEKNLLIIEEMFWKDIKKKLDDDNFDESYAWVYDEEKESFELRSRTHKLWQVMNSKGNIGTMWEERK